MKIIGNIKTANKFYIINSKGSIEWVPNIEVAKRYASTPSNIEWYGKDIYATDENLVKDRKGIIKLASQVKKAALPIKTIKQEFEDFKDQANQYVESKLQDFSKKYDYDTIWTMISWKESSVQKYKDEALLALKYRDSVYAYHFEFINSLEEKIKTNRLNGNNLSGYYDTYIKNFPIN